MSGDRADADLRAMAADRLRQARARIDMTDVCEPCRATADTWWKNLPRTDRQWPGGDQGLRFPAVRLPWPDRVVTVGPFLLPFHPRMDARTEAWRHIADWDVRNAEQIAHIADVCRAAGHSREVA